MIRVGVIRGGISTEHDESLATGEHILSHLRSDALKDKYISIDIYIDKNGVWHTGGISFLPHQLPHKVDVVINALHGEYGEDGKIQKILDGFNIPYTGSGVIPSAVGFNKVLAKEAFDRLGIKTPKHILYPAYQVDFDGPKDEYAFKKAHETIRQMPPPYIVKPLTGGSSMGIHVCKTFDDLVRAFRVGVGQNVSILVEEMIEGREATVGLIENFRGHSLYPLVPHGLISSEDKRVLESYAQLIHTGLGLQHYSQVDFIITPNKGIYALEVNTLPKMDKNSIFQKQLENIGSSFSEFIEQSIINAISK